MKALSNTIQRLYANVKVFADKQTDLQTNSPTKNYIMLPIYPCGGHKNYTYVLKYTYISKNNKFSTQQYKCDKKN